MKITVEDVRRQFEHLCSEQRSREEIADYAVRVMRLEDAEALDYDARDFKRIWAGIMYLTGVDLQSEPGIYLHSLDDYRQAWHEFEDE